MTFLCIRAEAAKLRRSIIWLACLLLPIIPAIMGVFNYQSNLGILTNGWYSLWSQVTLFYSNFFYAPLIALYAAYLWRMEHMDHNWNVLMTVPVGVSDIFFGKLAVILFVTVLTQMIIFIFYFIGGKFCGLSGLPPAEIFFWLLRGSLAGTAIGSLQLLLSMCIRSFALPIGIALLGSVMGLVISGFHAGEISLGLYWPYSLMLMGMNANRDTDTLAGNSLPFVGCVVLFFLLFTWIAVHRLKTRDVQA